MGEGRRERRKGREGKRERGEREEGEKTFLTKFQRSHLIKSIP